MATKHGKDAIEANKKRQAQFSARMKTIGIIVALAIAGLLVKEYLI